MRQSRKGYTLAEIMMVVAIIGILAALAVPNFTRSMNSASLNEARVNLNIINMAQKVYKLNRNTFWNGGANRTLAQINTALGTDLSGTNFTTYSITATGGTSFTATTTGLGHTLSINETGTITES